MITKYTIPHFFYQWAAVFLLLFLGGFMLCQAQTRSFTIGDVTFTMNFVEGGTFNMGAQNTDNTLPGYEAGADFNENPVHAVTVADFYMAPYLITQELWETLLYETPNAEFEQQWFEGAGLGNQYPAYYITYNDVQRFITALNDFCHYTQQLSDDEFFRLPTEAEWEYAARGGKQSQGYVYAGSNTASEVAWYVENSPESTQKVGLKKPNELGLYDMSGNVAEWCIDFYGQYESSFQENPVGQVLGSDRVIRGGPYSDDEKRCRVSARNSYMPSSCFENLGIRLVCD
jgi:formylglycine-generating enzyme required for sulfatase activity